MTFRQGSRLKRVRQWPVPPSLYQYIARAPVSLSKLIVEDHAATVLYHTTYNPYFRTNRKLFRATDFITSAATAPA